MKKNFHAKQNCNNEREKRLTIVYKGDQLTENVGDDVTEWSGRWGCVGFAVSRLGKYKARQNCMTLTEKLVQRC